jgi:hypothetical protein
MIYLLIKDSLIKMALMGKANLYFKMEESYFQTLEITNSKEKLFKYYHRELLVFSNLIITKRVLFH